MRKLMVEYEVIKQRGGITNVWSYYEHCSELLVFMWWDNNFVHENYGKILVINSLVEHCGSQQVSCEGLSFTSVTVQATIGFVSSLLLNAILFYYYVFSHSYDQIHGLVVGHNSEPDLFRTALFILRVHSFINDH
jgi:hypothetical protein